ncbi:hypothetical protein D030_4948B, partial [Vibrio parahaemolyticus AQ3810]
PWFIGT